jgi:hypothetical protein
VDGSTTTTGHCLSTHTITQKLSLVVTLAFVQEQKKEATTFEMNGNQQGREVVALEVPETLHDVFRYIDATEERQQLHFRRLTFTLLESDFLSNYMRFHSRAINQLCFDCCTFNTADSDGSPLVILKDIFLAAMKNGFLQRIQFILRKDDIGAAWFPLVTDFCTELCLCEKHGFSTLVLKRLSIPFSIVEMQKQTCECSRHEQMTFRGVVLQMLHVSWHSREWNSYICLTITSF